MKHLNPQAETIRRRFESLKRSPGEPHLRDVLQREYEEGLTKGRNEALEKWGPMIEDEITRDLAVRRQTGARTLDGPDME